jgi:uncharacterized Zn finger protein (UPF0148 family)
MPAIQCSQCGVACADAYSEYAGVIYCIPCDGREDREEAERYERDALRHELAAGAADEIRGNLRRYGVA